MVFAAGAPRTRQTFEVEIFYGGQTFNFYVATALETNKWNKIELKFDQGVLKVSVGALSRSIAINTDFQIDFGTGNWYLGANNLMGIAGHVDGFLFEDVSVSKPG